MQRNIEEYVEVEGKPVVGFGVGEAVRNANYRLIKPNLSDKRRRVYEVIVGHPEGICNKDIAKELRFPINSVTGRVSELVDLELVRSDGVVYKPDFEGRMHPNTVWKVNGLG